MVIQFICRGNAFRSIIAEAYLNSLSLPSLTVLSSGTVASTYKESNLVNFQKTLALLKKHGIERFAKDHYADNIKQELLDKSNVVIWLNKIAFDEAAGLFKLPQEVYVWDVTDLGEKGRVAKTESERKNFAEDAYQEIAKNIDDLVRQRQLR